MDKAETFNPTAKAFKEMNSSLTGIRSASTAVVEQTKYNGTNPFGNTPRHASQSLASPSAPPVVTTDGQTDQLLSDAVKKSKDTGFSGKPVADRLPDIRTLVSELIVAHTRGERPAFYCDQASSGPHVLLTVESSRRPSVTTKTFHVLEIEGEPVVKRSHQFGIVLTLLPDDQVKISVYGPEAFRRGTFTARAENLLSILRNTVPQDLVTTTGPGFDANARNKLTAFLTHVGETFREHGRDLEQISSRASEIYRENLGRVFAQGGLGTASAPHLAQHLTL